jgi:hypothetical protein
MEICNEKVRDLLHKKSDVLLELREDPKRGVIIDGLTDCECTSLKEYNSLIMAGNNRRRSYLLEKLFNLNMI